MLPFFQGVFEFFQTIFNFIIGLFEAFWQLLTTVVESVTFVTSLVGILPEFVQVACLACLGITVIYLIVNHGGS